MPEAQYALGKLLLSDDMEVRDPDEGIRWLNQAAENGNHFAAYRLGKEYLTGETLTKDTSKAAKWFTRSAEAGNQYAQYMLGKLYLTGQGVTRDQAQAMVWFSRSAAQGNQYAQFFLEHQNDLRPPSVMLAATRLLYHMSRIFENHALPTPAPAYTLTANSEEKSRRRKSPWATSRTTMRSRPRAEWSWVGCDHFKNCGAVNNKKASKQEKQVR